WARRRPAIAALLGLVLLTATLGFGLVTWKWLDAEQQRQAAERAREREQRTAQEREEALGKARAEEEKARRAAAGERRAAYLNLVALAHNESLGNNTQRAHKLLHACPEELRGWEWPYLARLS